MIVWGGALYDKTGGRYNPATDSWTATTTINAPDGRIYYSAVWTGSEMIVWGGEAADLLFNTGGRYDPSTDIWTATRSTNAPAARNSHTAVWTGSEMIVWGGLTTAATLTLVDDTARSRRVPPRPRLRHRLQLRQQQQLRYPH